MEFLYAGYDVSGDTENVAYAYIGCGEGWHRGVALDLGEDAQIAETVDVFVSSEDDGYTTSEIYRSGQRVDAVMIDGVTYAIYAAVA